MVVNSDRMVRRLLVSGSLLLAIGGLIFLAVSGPLLAQQTSSKAKLPKFKLATAHFPPFRNYEDNMLSGSDTDIVSELFHRMGYEPEIAVAPFKRAYSMGSTGEVGAVFTMTKNPERESLFLFSDPISSVTDVLFKHKDNKLEWNSYADLKGFNIGMSLGYSYPESFLNALDANMFKPDFVGSAEPELMHLKKLAGKRIDFAICEISVCSWLILRNPDLAGLVPMKKPVAPARTFHLGFSKKLPNAAELVKKFNKELARFVAKGQRREVFKKYNMPDLK